ncbi:hypothetical protein [Bauldia sp.]|uniref:hypothetical protein n=1 Tax=Bauldia sp. TaxID=2575872 RepID=UPI003BAD6B9A
MGASRGARLGIGCPNYDPSMASILGWRGVADVPAATDDPAVPKRDRCLARFLPIASPSGRSGRTLMLRKKVYFAKFVASSLFAVGFSLFATESNSQEISISSIINFVDNRLTDHDLDALKLMRQRECYHIMTLIINDINDHLERSPGLSLHALNLALDNVTPFDCEQQTFSRVASISNYLHAVEDAPNFLIYRYRNGKAVAGIAYDLRALQVESGWAYNEK